MRTQNIFDASDVGRLVDDHPSPITGHAGHGALGQDVSPKSFLQMGNGDHPLAHLLFAKPQPPILPVSVSTLAKARGQPGHSYLFYVRRSARLANKRRMSTMLQRAQETIAHKLGTLPEGANMNEETLM